MQAVFTYGNMKSGLTPRTILFGAWSPTAVYDFINPQVNNGGQLPYTPEQTASLADLSGLTTVSAVANRILEIDIAISTLKAYRGKVTSYYDMRVSRTSGGKQDRLRNERRDLYNVIDESLSLLTSARVGAATKKTAVAVASQDDYNPNTGKPLTPAEKEALAEKGGSEKPFDFSKLILPIGAGLAALFFLKGH